MPTSKQNLAALRRELLRVEGRRLNPLVGWEDTSGRTSRDALEPHVPLVQKGAKGRYAEVYNRVGLPLAVVLHPTFDWSSEELRSDADPDTGLDVPETERAARLAEDTQIAKRLNAIVLSVSVGERSSKPFYATPDQRRGSTERTSPYTPFVLLHRLGDRLSGWRDPHLAMAAEMVDKLTSAEMRKRHDGLPSRGDVRLSRGVDTAAGRMGVIDEDYLSDLWAKWLLTGRIAYSPTNPPPESAKEARFRNMLAKYAPQIFRIWHDYLMQAIPVVIEI